MDKDKEEVSLKDRLAYSPRELARKGPFGRTKIYELLATGKLRGKKCGRSTIITDAAYRECLENLPDYESHANEGTVAV